MLAVMPYSAFSSSHDSSLDDVGLLRRCERRIATFPDCSYDFSFTSADTSSSGVLPANSATVFGTSVDDRSDDSFIATIETPDTTFLENTSVNRNPCQDSRRWAGRDDSSFQTRCKSLGQNFTSKDLVSKLPEFAQQMKQSNPNSAPLSAFTARRGCATQQKTEASDVSSKSSPIVDNLILEPELGLKHTSERRSTSRSKAARYIQNEAYATNVTVSRETGAQNPEVKKQRSHACRQPLIARSLQGKREVLDPGSEVYLKKLDNILQKMSDKGDRPSWRVAEKITRSVNSKDANPNPVSKNGKPSSGKRSCNCPCKTPNKDKLNAEAGEVRRTTNTRGKTSVKQDPAKPDTSTAVSRSAVRSRCTRVDKRKHAAGAEAANSACKDTTKQVTEPASVTERSTGSCKKRSKSLSAPTRCPLHDSTTDPTHGSVKLKSCESTCSSRKCYVNNVDPGNLSRQQIEILKHIPGDLTPVEAGTVLQTVLSIIQQRHCVKRCAQGDDCLRKDHRGVPEWNHDSLSKYETDSMSDKCFTSTSLSPKSKLCFSDRQKETIRTVVKTRRSSESLSCMNDSRSAEGHGQGDNNSLDFDIIKQETEACTINVSIDAREQTQTDHRFPAKLTSNSSNFSDCSSLHFAHPTTAYGQAPAHKTEQMPKKSAIVLPFDGKFKNQSIHQQGDGDSRQSCSSQIHSPVSHDAADCRRIQRETSHKQHRRLSSVPNTNTSTISRHIGWKYPLHTPTDIRDEAADAAERGTLEHSFLTEHTSMARSYSTLSDGFLYSKYARTSKRIPQQDRSKNFLFSAEQPGILRESSCGVEFQQHSIRENRSGPLSIIRPEIPAEQRPFLRPCPHASEQPGQSLACQKGTNLDQTQERPKSKLDEIIEDLRVQLQDSLYNPVKIKHTTGNNTATLGNEDKSQANLLLSHSRNIQARMNKFVQIETRAKGQHQSEVTYSDNISCSKDMVLTNSSFSNKTLVVGGEFPCIHRQQLNSISVNEAIDLPSCPAFPFQRNNQWASNIRVDHTPGDVRLETDMAPTLLNQAARLPYRREGPLTALNGNQCPIYTETRETTQETCRDSSTGLLTLPRATISRLMTFESKSGSDGCRVRNESLLPREGASHNDSLSYGCDPNEERGQVGHTYSQREYISPMSFRKLNSRETSRPCMEPFDSTSTIETGNLNRSSETLATVERQQGNIESNNSTEQISVLKPYNVDKLTSAVQSPGKLGSSMHNQSGIRAEPLSRRKPTNSRRSPNSSQLTKNEEPLKNLDPHLVVKSPTKVQPPINEKTHSKVKSPSRFEHTPYSPSNDEATEQAGSTSSAAESGNPDLARLKESTESLLAEVYRKYYADLYAPNLECAGTSEWSRALLYLRGFSPISQVDVNTQYPLTIDNEPRLSSKETTKNNEKPSKSTLKIATVVPAVKLSNQKQISANTRNITQNSSKMVSTLAHSDVGNERSTRISNRDMNKQALRKHRSNSNNTDTNLYFKLQGKDQSNLIDSQTYEARADILIPDRSAGPVGDKTGPTVLDVTSFHHGNYPFRQSESAPECEDIPVYRPELVVKTYTTRSAVPVDVKVIREINDRNVLYSENTKRPTFSKLSPCFQTDSTLRVPVVVCGSDAPKWPHKGIVNTRGKCTSSGCPSCTVACFKSSASSARQKLISGAINSGKLMSSNSSLASGSCDELEVESEAVSYIEAKEYGSCGVDCNNSSSRGLQRGRHICQHS